MTVPLAGVTLSAQQVAAQRLQQQQQGAGQQLKTGSSKFDGVMANKASGTQAASGVSAPSAAQRTDIARAVEQTQRADKARLDKVSVHQKVTERPAVESHSDMHMLGSVLTKMAKGQNVMDGLIHAAVSGQHFSNAELLGLQAGVYKYTQEMELTGKVVEKATDGLQQTLKTQV